MKKVKVIATTILLGIVTLLLVLEAAFFIISGIMCQGC